MSAVSSGPVPLPFESLLLATPAVLGLRVRISILQPVITPIRFAVPVVNLRVAQAPIRLAATLAPAQLPLLLIATLTSPPEALGLYDEPVQRPVLAFQ